MRKLQILDIIKKGLGSKSKDKILQLHKFKHIFHPFVRSSLSRNYEMPKMAFLVDQQKFCIHPAHDLSFVWKWLSNSKITDSKINLNLWKTPANSFKMLRNKYSSYWSWVNSYMFMASSNSSNWTSPAIRAGERMWRTNRIDMGCRDTLTLTVFQIMVKLERSVITYHSHTHIVSITGFEVRLNYVFNMFEIA